MTILSWHYHFLKANIQTSGHFQKHLGKSMNKKKKTSLNLCCLSVVLCLKRLYQPSDMLPALVLIVRLTITRYLTGISF